MVRLAASVALMARDRGGPPLVFQLLNYPVIDDRMQTPSMRAFDATPLWTSGATADMWEHYLGDPEERGEVSPYAAPGRAHDLTGLPPAYVLTAELDPLRDEGIEYASRLMAAGVPTELHTVAGRVPRVRHHRRQRRARSARHRRAGARPGAGTGPRYRLIFGPGRPDTSPSSRIRVDARDVVDGTLEGGPIGLGRSAVAAHLPDVLQGGGPHVLVGHGLGAPQGHDASAHADTVPHPGDPVPSPRSRPPTSAEV